MHDELTCNILVDISIMVVVDNKMFILMSCASD
jgi:hypothetical protein